MEVEAVVKKWGNSLGVVLPKDLINQEHIEENDRILVDIRKEADLKKIFGTLKTKTTGKEFKEFVKKGWEDGN